tara:strand:+ start:234 stop:887 length:654 start_codon:yes stop_codon:yes gene_type:complete
MITCESIFGKIKETAIFESSERKSNSKFIKYKFNAYSSIAYIVTAFYLLNNTNDLFYINYIGIAISLLLGIVSFFWWALKRENIQKVDICLYSALILWIGIYALCKLNSKYEIEISLFFVLLLLIFSYKVCCEIYRKKIIATVNIVSFILSITILIYIAEVYKIYNLYYSVGLTIVGFLFKFADTYKLLDPEIIGSGTGWFHILTSIGISLIWNDLQ